LAQDQIRILVFRDCDRKGKTLLFDSKVITQDLNQQVRSTMQLCNCNVLLHALVLLYELKLFNELHTKKQQHAQMVTNVLS